MRVEKSQALYRDAKRYTAVGPASPTGAFDQVGRDPRFMVGGSGAHLFDADGNEYIDLALSGGAMVLGHADPKVVEALCDAVSDGVAAGVPTERETALAKVVTGAIPSVDLLCLTGSEAEAMAGAVRVARAFARKSMVVKFAGCSPSWSDGTVAAAGESVHGRGRGAGVSDLFVGGTGVVPYNDLESAEVIVKSQHREIAAMVVEPVATSIGLVPPAPSFLPGLRALCDRYGIVLIFDELVTGMRLHWGGAETLYGVRPDLVCLGRAVAGGLGLGAYGGRRDIMETDVDAPAGPAAHPLAITAAIATLSRLREPGSYAALEALSAKLAGGLSRAAEAAGVPVRVNRVGSMMTVFFTDVPVVDLATASATGGGGFRRFFGSMIESGVLIPPRSFGCICTSLAHSADDMDRVVSVAESAFAEAVRGRQTERA